VALRGVRDDQHVRRAGGGVGGGLPGGDDGHVGRRAGPG
jgi:hypothetical protein